jgi:DNA-binding NtrC family response regulator
MTTDGIQPITAGKTVKPATPQRILIVDDEPAILFAYRKLIEREGIDVDISESLDEALEMIRVCPYFAIIADMRLAGTDNEDGMEILRTIQEMRPDTKVILATGYGNSETERKALALGASHYFEKPVMPAAILAALKEISSSAPG